MIVQYMKMMINSQYVNLIPDHTVLYGLAFRLIRLKI